MKKYFIVISAFLVTAMLLFSAAAFAGSSSYIRGDADGNGSVTIDDVTMIQKVLAELEPDANGKITKRSNIDGDVLSITDATAVQMYIAGFSNENKIGETVEEQVTTQQPTTRSYELPFIPCR